MMLSAISRCTIQDGTVTHQIGNFQAEGNAALLRAFQIAGAAQFEIGFGDDETVVALGHDFHPLTRIGRQLIGSDENAVRLIGTAPYPATQLM